MAGVRELNIESNEKWVTPTFLLVYCQLRSTYVET